MNILINNKKVNFKTNDFPILIHGYPKTGSSLFSVALLADLLKNDNKVIFFSAYPEAKEVFRNEINSIDVNALIIDSGDEQVFIETIKNINDLNERIVLIKNIENYSLKLFEVVRDLKYVIFSGNIDECNFIDELIKKEFITKIFFSQSKKYYQDEIEDLPRYFGKITSKEHNGLISLENKN